MLVLAALAALPTVEAKPNEPIGDGLNHTPVMLPALPVPEPASSAPQEIIPNARDYVYIMDTIREPVPDLIKLDIPAELGNRELARLGIVDVTAKPFEADPTGARDSTRAIQEAVNLSIVSQMVCYFPPGTYKISDTLSCIKPAYRRRNGAVVSGKNFSAILVGSAADPARRARIVLAPNSKGFSDEAAPKYVIHMWAPAFKTEPYQAQSNINYNQMFVNIDVEIGAGNSGAIAVRNRAAQGSSVQNVTIDATHGFKGLEGGAGSGGSHHNITVIGGKIGVDLLQAQPAATLSGLTLINQTYRALVYGGAQTLCAVGLKIVSRTRGPVIEGVAYGKSGCNGQMVIVDSSIEFDRPNEDNVGITTIRSFHLNNVYFRNAGRITNLADGTSIQGNSAGWARVAEYAHEMKSPPVTGFPVAYNIYVDGKRASGDVYAGRLGEAPPEDLQTRHMWPADSPLWDSPGAVDVKAAPYHAKGDGRTDDTDALQKAIDENKIVLLPKGVYIVSRTIELKPNSKLVGVGQSLSIIAVKAPGDWFNVAAADARPIVATANTADAEANLSFIGIHSPSDVPGSHPLLWRSGGGSIFRSNMLISHAVGGGATGRRAEKRIKWVEITGAGGGKWYNFFAEHPLEQKDAKALFIHGTSGRLGFYQLNAEGARSRTNVEIADSANVDIYGMKGEGNSHVLYVRSCDNIRLFGYGGNGSGKDGSTLFYIENTPNLLLSGLVDFITPEGKVQLRGAVGHDPNKWHMVIYNDKGGEEIRVRPLDRPILFKMGRTTGAGG